MGTARFIPIDLILFIVHILEKLCFKCFVDDDIEEFEQRETKILHWFMQIRICVHYFSSLFEFIWINLAHEDYTRTDSPSKDLFWCLISLLVVMAVFYFVLCLLLKIKTFTYRGIMIISYLFKHVAVLFDILLLTFSVYITAKIQGDLDYVSGLIVLDTACAITSAVLTPIAYILFLKDYVEDCKCCKKKQVQPVISIICIKDQSNVTLNGERKVGTPPVLPGPSQTIIMATTDINCIKSGITVKEKEDGSVKIDASIKQVQLKQTALGIHTKTDSTEALRVEVTTTLLKVESTRNVLLQKHEVGNSEMKNESQDTEDKQLALS